MTATKCDRVDASVWGESSMARLAFRMGQNGTTCAPVDDL